MVGFWRRKLIEGLRRNLSTYGRLKDGKGQILQILSPKYPSTNKLINQKRRMVFRVSNPPPPQVVGYYIVFPAIPDETVENNAFLRNIAANEDWPALNSASPKEMYEGTVRLLMEYGATVLEHTELLENDKNYIRDFDNIVEPLITEEYDVDYAFSTVLLKMLTDWPECSHQAFAQDLYNLKAIVAHEHAEKLVSKEFQEALQIIYDNREGLDSWKLRLVEWYLLEIRASGGDIADEKKRRVLSSWMRFIDEYASKYMINLMCTNDQNIFQIQSRTMLKHAPPHILKLLADGNPADEGPWRALMKPDSIDALLRYCGDRQLRSMAWDRWISKASFEHDFYNNSVVIEEIRHNNDGMAKLLGYSSIAEHRLANKMAGSPETVRNFLNELVQRVRPVFIDRNTSWSTYATNKEMISGELQPFDLWYICEREAEEHYGADLLDLMHHFPFWPTFTNVIEIISHLLNLQFVDISESNLERCHPSVRIYAVLDKSTDEHLGRLYIDPFMRPNKTKTWHSILGRPFNEVRKLDKLVYLIGAAGEPNACGESFLHHTQLQKLLFNLGKAIQYMLSRSPYRDITIPLAPRYASDWDAADYFPAFMQFFVYKPNLLSAMSSANVKTGEALQSKADAVCLALQRSTLWDTYRTLFWSDFDLSICELEDRRKKFWLDLYKEMYAEYFPFERERNNYQPCSFAPIFAMQPFLGMYYRKLWTEMLAFDIHETFYREQDERSTGERLKNVLLNTGSGEVQSELYRTFQGRDPSVGAICDFYDPPAQIHQ